MDFPEVICGNIFNIGQVFLNIKLSDFDNNWIFAPILCILVIIEFLIINSNQKSIEKNSKKFINFVDSDRFGCWLIILLPMILYHYKSYNDFLIILIGGFAGLIYHCFYNDAFLAGIFNVIILVYLLYNVYILSILSSIIYPILLTTIMSKALPSFFVNSFLLGESILLSQLISLFMFKSFYFSLFIIYYLSLIKCTTENVHNSSIVSIFITLCFSLITFLCCTFFKKDVLNEISNLIFIIFTIKNIVLIIFWLFLLFVCLVIVYLINSITVKNDEEKSLKSTLHLRKLFHFCASIVFLSGLFYDAIYLINICSILLLILMLMLEHIRRKKIGKIGEILQNLLQPFFDKRDNGALVLSPIGLLCGLSLSFWISSLYETYWSLTDRFWLCSGIITVGIGDSFAALVGRQFGKHFWNNKLKERTLEGSLACYMSQLIMCSFLVLWFNIPFDEICIQRAFLAVLTTTFVEAHTCQLDNFVLPLVFYSFQ